MYFLFVSPTYVILDLIGPHPSMKNNFATLTSNCQGGWNHNMTHFEGLHWGIFICNQEFFDIVESYGIKEVNV